MSSIISWLEQFSGSIPSMAWCHCTDAYSLKSMIVKGQFEPTECDVFNEKLSYFFYGRPAYKSQRTEPISTKSFAPVALLLDPTLTDQAKRIFPFDTGAFARKRYSKWIHSQMKRDDFEITNVSKAANKHVEAFFGSNESYYNCNPKSRHEFDETEFEVEAIAVMINDLDSKSADDRRIAIEMQTETPIPFTSQYVKAVIAPSEVFAAAWMKDFLKKAGKGIKRVQYTNLNFSKPQLEYQGTLEEKAKELQKNWNLL